ncbi:MAG: carbon starvation CstA family protein [Bacteroidales bacterium]|nr:carbon starvation CstA family protein [Bacteroidales bacterium]
MYSFVISLIALIAGYLIYGGIIDRMFGPEPERKTPCYTMADGVDYQPMATWKVYLVQFLNIAGTGPIFGAIMGILFGPAAYLWIVFGCIFAGAVHDYLCGMISIRKGGASLPEIIGDELGNGMRIVMRVFSLVLLVLVGTVFVTTPAGLLANLTESWSWTSVGVWTALIFIYYILATLLPIDALIGRIYPVFGVALLIMALGVGIGIFINDGWMPELTDMGQNVHPKGLPIIPMLCITIACGAISGFHATQTPLMSRCLKNERHGRRIFYGAMITEGIVALIWAAAAIKFASTLNPGAPYEGLAEMGNPAIVVNKICSTWLGTIGAILAVLGVVAAPITSGDTAFRSARLIAADFLKMDQTKIWRRLVLVLPLFGLSCCLLFLDFNVLWRYFAWCNQTLATIVLWGCSVWLLRNGKNCWFTVVPATFMTFICTSYILCAPEGFTLDLTLSLGVGLCAAVVALGGFIKFYTNYNSSK